ncbi:SUMO-conjugating enzyme UBC9 [Astathelohania contejeani]|uniref:SUMO-conjugating enzyme UBC9 n=1 Tax=Astathelohania contejeani TaxID=164912 RepID=A0ABQ7HVM5_9MICR|nr:SUMO-conjugating enzyme UBC9 [Thelohania contejeani]
MNIERLRMEKKNLRKSRNYLFFAHPTDKITEWECGIPGPDDPLYRDAYYRLKMTFPRTYPLSPPTVQFHYPVYHPNVYPGGNICLDILGPRWKPHITIQQILSGIQHLLLTPNNRSPANSEASSIFKKGNKEYEKKVKENIKKYHTRMPWEDQ